jgi:enolase
VIKTGVVGGERVVKLNELIRIWDYMGKGARMNNMLAEKLGK